MFGTAEFSAPEVVTFDEIGFYTDMWSVGVICYVLWVYKSVIDRLQSIAACCPILSPQCNLITKVFSIFFVLVDYLLQFKAKFIALVDNECKFSFACLFRESFLFSSSTQSFDQKILRRVFIFRFYQRSAHIEVQRSDSVAGKVQKLTPSFYTLLTTKALTQRLEQTDFPTLPLCSLSGLSPFVGADDFETMTNVSLAKYSFDYAPFDEISSEAKDFVEKLLMKEPSKRLTGKRDHLTSLLSEFSHRAIKNKCENGKAWGNTFLAAKNALAHEWLHCTKGNSEREITLSLTKTKLKRYVILRRWVW